MVQASVKCRIMMVSWLKYDAFTVDMMTPNLRHGTLTAHITSSVGWFGAVAGFLVLSIAGLASANAQTVRAVYIAMEVLGWFVIVPFCLASLATGLVQSLGTPWGLLRHY